MQVAILFEDPQPLTTVEREEQLAAEHDGTEIEAVESSLRELGHRSERMPVGDNVTELVARLRSGTTDLVFNLCETFRRESLPQMNIPAMLDLSGIRYTGSGAQALAVSTDKALSKALLADRGIPVPRSRVLYGDELQTDVDLDFPLIVKPLYEDGSYGITEQSVVESLVALQERIRYVLDKYRQPSIVEEFIDGREINASVLDTDPPIVLPLSEIQFREFPASMPRICSFQAKWVSESFQYRNTVALCPADVTPDLEARITDIALRSHITLGCRGYSRVDLRLGSNLQPFVIEVNANPDISPGAGYVRSLLQSGRSYTDLVAALVACALVGSTRDRCS